MSDGLFARAAALSRFMTDTRRALHMIPEQSFREADTRRYLLSLFSDAECEKRELSCGSVALFFDFGKENTAAFRCELDALPVNELNESAYKSNRKGFMHACGHDGHMAVCAALCRVLGALSEEEKSKAKRNALVLFQSGEESAGGAQAEDYNSSDSSVDLSYLAGIWYLDGDLDADSYIYIDSSGGLWGLYERAPGAETTEVDGGFISAPTDVDDVYYAVSTTYQDVTYEFTLFDTDSIVWGGENDYYERLE